MTEESPWHLRVENLRMTQVGLVADTGVTVAIKDVRLIGTVEVDGKKLQVNLIAPELFMQRQTRCTRCRGNGAVEERFVGWVPCDICGGRGVRFL